MRGDLQGGPAGLPSEPPKVAWAFLCPNPTCDTELVVLPDQAGMLVECPTCGFQFTAPDAEGLADAPQAVEPVLDAKESGAADALGSLAGPDTPRRRRRDRGGAEAVYIPVPPRRPPRQADAGIDISEFPGLAGKEAPGAERRSRASRRLGLGQLLVARTLQREPHVHVSDPKSGPAAATPAQPPQAPPAAPPRPKVAAGLVLTWIVAVLVSGGIAAAALAIGKPDLALVGLLFIGLAALRTVLVLRDRGGRGESQSS